MTITRDQKATLVAAGGTTTTLTWPTLPTAGAKVLVAFTLGSSIAPTSVIDNGTSPTTFTQDAGPGSATQRLYVYRADNITLPASGSYSVTITWPSGSGGCTAWGASYLGVATGGPTASKNGTATSTSVATGTATPNAAGALFFAAFEDNSGLNPETITLTGSGFTSQATQTNGATLVCAGFADKIDAGGPTATSCTWTLGDSCAWGAQIVTYDAAAGLAPTAALAGQGSATALPVIRVSAALAGQGAASGQPGATLTIVQAATPVFLASLTGPVNVTLAQATGSGNSLVVCASAGGSTLNPQVTGITLGGSTDNWENVAVLNVGVSTDAEVWYDPNCAAGQTAVAVTFGNGSGTGNLWVSVYEVSGVIAADRRHAGEINAGTFSSGTTATVTQSSEIFFGCVNGTATTITPTGVGSWTSETLGGGTLGSTHCSAHQNTTTGGTATFSGTLNAPNVSTAVVATFYLGTPQARWATAVFQQIDNSSAGYIGTPQLTSALQSPHADFPGGSSPQTNQSLPCFFEPFTDYFQAGFPWPAVAGFMSPPWITGPSQTGLTNVIASLYLGTGVGSMTDFDASGLPLNKKVLTSPSSTASLPIPAGSWPGAPTMPGGGTAIPAIPLIAWHLGSTSLVDIAAGLHDADTIIPVAQQCAAWPADGSGNPAFGSQPGGQVLIRLMHEFNLPATSLYCPGSSSQPSTCTAATFVAAWQHIVNVFAAQGATNVRWVWCPNTGGTGAANGTHAGFVNTSGTIALCYPGDAYVDYIGMDGYNKNVSWTKFQAVFQTTYNFIVYGDAFTGGPISTTKPMIICETSSYEDDMFTSPPQTKAQWIGDIINGVRASMPLIQGVMWWHNCTDALEWPTTSSAASQTAWNTVVTTWTGRPAVIAGVTSALNISALASIGGTGTATATATVLAGGAAAGAGLAQISGVTVPVTPVAGIAGAGAAGAVATVGAQAALTGAGAARPRPALRIITVAVAGAGRATGPVVAGFKVDISAEPQATVAGRLVLNTATQGSGKAVSPTQGDGKTVAGAAVTILVGNITQDRGN